VGGWLSRFKLIRLRSVSRVVAFAPKVIKMRRLRRRTREGAEVWADGWAEGWVDGWVCKS